ncbi:MAG: omptin family outer membrane protease [Deltaproteobacteria bacterium]|nr:omptin family outer membrane protease [Deltaproteobacteria bacterium]
MKKILAVSACLFLLLGSRAAYAGNSDFSLGTGYRSDKLDWNIAGDTTGHNPNVLSELKWESLKIFEIKAGFRTDLNKRQYLLGSFGFGWINDGTNQDSDYRGDNRTLEYSRSSNDADLGNVWDLSLGIGLNNNIRPNLSLNPVIGVSFHRQNLRIRNGFQTVATSGTPPVGPFAYLNSKYDANWYGPWAGIDVKYAAESLVYTGGLELHLARYLAEADWNLRTDLDHPKSFEHTALGGGVRANAGVRYAVTERLSLTGNAAYQRWMTMHGRDRTFFKNGTTADTRLNEVNWSSYDLSLGAGYSF